LVTGRGAREQARDGERFRTAGDFAMQHRPTNVVAVIRSLALVALTAGALACSPGSGDRSSPVSAAGGNGGAEPTRNSAGSGGRGLVIDIGGSAGSEPIRPPKVCTAESHEGQRVPVDMYFLVDSSGSMAERVDGGSKWEVVSDALIGFLNDPLNAETGVGIGYFPNTPQGSCSKGQPGCVCIPFIDIIIDICFANAGGSCEVADYATPAVPLALPPSPSPVVDDINGHEISGGTPTRPAVEGALQYLNQWAEAHPERRPVLVLATDGDPSGCEANTPQDIADVAAAGLAGAHAIRTFVIGVGSSLVSLNLVAQAGGTGQAFLVDTGADVAKLFSDALDQIRGQAASCDFAIPAENAQGMAIDPSLVNVTYTPNGASAATLVPQTFMNDMGNCGSEGGWYYDNPSAPRLIRLCDSTCDLLSAGSIQVEFGCDTVVQPPK
jgi:Mg-chelatase subunit ChlD